MTRTTYLLSSLSALLLLVSAAFSSAHAGQRSFYSGYCQNLDSSGTMAQCVGNLTDIANQPVDPTRWADFNKYGVSNTDVTLLFMMRFNGNFYSCVAPLSMLDLFSTAMASHSMMFNIVMNRSTGVCTFLGVNNESDSN